MKIVHITASSNMLLTNYMDNYLFLFFTKCAQNETRTRDPNLGKVMLYQLSYFRKLNFFIQ